MHMMDDCETSLQILRGFDADITAEVNDIKVRTYCYSSRLSKYNLFGQSSLCVLLFYLTMATWLCLLHSYGIGGTNF